MVKYNPKCLLEVTNSSSHNLPNHMISSFANQTHHNQQQFYQTQMGTCCFNTHLNVFFRLTSDSLQFENRLLNTTMALSSKIKRATRMYILRRYHLPAVAMCAMKSLISGRGFLHRQWGGGRCKCSCTSSSSRMKTRKDVQYSRRFEVICCAIALHIRKKLKEQILMDHLHLT